MRVGEKEVSERAEIVARYAELFTRQQLDALREAETESSGGEERERLYRLRKTCEAGPDLGRAGRARRRARERDPGRPSRVQGRGAAAANGPGPARGAPRATPTATSSALLATDVSATFNDERLEVLRAGEKLEAEVSGIDDPIARTEEEKGISLRELERALADAERGGRGRLRRAARDVVRAAARARSAKTCRLVLPRRLPAPALAAREHLHQGAGGPDLHGHARATRLRPRGGAEHQARPRRPAAEVAARLRDPRRPAADRSPDHARAGRAPRLPGVPARGRARTALRGRRSDAAVHLPQHLARPRADGDLLVHRRGDLPAARLARALLRPLRTTRPRENAEATVFMEALLFRRYVAKLQFELDFWGRFGEDGGTDRRLRRAAYRRRPGCATARRATSPTWTPASTRPTTCAPGSARLSCAPTSSARSATSGGPSEDTGDPAARPLQRGHEALERGDRRPHRLRAARHGPLLAELGA